MKVIGGSFGADGKAEIGNANIVINDQLIGRSKIQSMTASQHRERQFSLMALLIGVFLFVPMCWAIAAFFFGSAGGMLAGLAAFVFTMFATFDHSESRLVTISIEGGKSVTIQCKKKEAQALMAMAP